MPWRRLPEVLPRLRRRLGFRSLERLTLGSTGLWSPASLAEARRLLRPWARRVRALSDVELAHHAAFRGAAGVLVVSGTGSIALARDRRGRRRRAGGWGQLVGDDGSGFWIGREALRDAGLRRRLRLPPPALAPTPENVRKVAALAPRVLKLSCSDARARRVLREAARHLAGLARESAAGLSWGGRVPVCGWGGVFQDEALAAAFGKALGPKYKAVTPELEADEAAALL